MTQIKSLRTGIKFKDTPIGKIPVDWEARKLGDVCDVIGGSTPSTAIKEYWDGDILWATPTDITKLKGRTIEETKLKISEKGLKYCAANLLSEGSILMTSRATIGACAINIKPMATNQGFASLICKERAYNWFVYYLILFFRKELERLGSGSTFKEISKKSIKSFYIPIPPLSEQTKIAEILTTVDDAIEETDRIIEKTKELKKGLMQKLLTRGIGHKKFKKTEIGEIPEEWDVGRIADFGEIVTGSTPGTAVKEYYGNDFPFVSPFDLGKVKVITRAEKYLSKEGSSIARMLPANTVLFVCIGSTIGKVGIAGVELATNQQINSIICKKNDFNFVYYYLDFIRDKIKQMAGTQAVPIVNKSLFSNVTVAMPELKEQKEIGNILSSVDEDVEEAELHRQTLETLKKSLMQVLLTGKVRVKLH